MINKAIFEEQWDTIRGQSNARWSMIFDFDLNRVDKADVKFDKFVTMLQVKYGYTRQKALEELGKFWGEYTVKNKDNPLAFTQVIEKTRSKTNDRSRRKAKTQTSLQGDAHP